MNEAKMNFNTSTNLKKAFLDLCKEERVTATARFNDFMRSRLSECGKGVTKNTSSVNRSIDGWRDELVRG